VSFEVKRGEVVGIIGRNGAGKSTLLKILSRITEPTEGRVTLRGRVASLLEVGTGFHPELTGRENIFLNGAILGMTKAEIRKKFDEIVAFAEVERFLDTPVKRYSSGMYVRLAFAVAAHLEPEILVVDEVLAVGDADFQKKCLGKMKDVATGGRTVLFVSHNMNAVAALTSRCLYLAGGRCQQLGSTERIIRDYLRGGQNNQAVYEAQPSPGQPRVVRAEIKTSEPGSTQHHGKGLTVEFDIHMPEARTGNTFSFQILDSTDRPVVHLWRFDQEKPFLRKKGMTKVICHIPKCQLNVGHYSLRTFLAGAPGQPLQEMLERICPFEVVILDRQTLFGWRPETCTYLEEAFWKDS
jgi:lipopolysaccharide transport system ATP-binding protein